VPIYEFECPNGHITDWLTTSFDTETKYRKCETCGEKAVRIISSSGTYKMKDATRSGHDSRLGQGGEVKDEKGNKAADWEIG
jgi:putative FmdB family regulatory protein